MSAVSVVVPVYNAKNWLSRFFACLQSQTLADFEVLLVDDASTDESATLIQEIAATDPRFKLVSQETQQGSGAARNRGIKMAASETLCFADPDDLLPHNSLEVRYAAYKTHHAIVRACHNEVLSDGTVHHRETRPQGLQELCDPIRDSARIGVNPFLCAHWTWLFPTNLLRRYDIFNGEGMRTAEDIILLVLLFFHMKRVVWIPDTVYYWMKRSDSLSTTVYTPEHYADYFQCCELFYEQAEANGQLRLADTFFNSYLTIYCNHLAWQVLTGKSNEEDVRKTVSSMLSVCKKNRVFDRCLVEMQKRPQRHAGLWRLWHMLEETNPSWMLRLLAAQQAVDRNARVAEFAALRQKGWSREITFDRFDAHRNLLRARYLFCGTHPEENYDRGGVSCEPAFSKNRLVFHGEDAPIFERILWLGVPPEQDVVCRLQVGGLASSLHHTPAQVREAFLPRPLKDQGFPAEVRALRHLARSAAIREKFLDAWLFLDRDNEADDNAEHLYRWVAAQHPEVNAWFVLRKDSHDWERLREEGFRLVPHGSMEHFALFLNCTHLISSHMDRYIYAPLEERFFTDFPRPQYTCLQHGVTKDDISNWLNGIAFDFFITVTHDEDASFVNDGTGYELTRKEVILTGFPRHDKLLEPAPRENILFVMPTWRTHLVGAWDGKGQRREINPHFYESQFVASWRAVFQDPRMQALLDNYAYRMVYFAHPCLDAYIDNMPFPAYVERLSKKNCSIMDFMRKSKILITDFSSVAFDMAANNSAILYYQTEEKNDYATAQKWEKGFFNYEAMGFGPVCRDLEALFLNLEKAMAADGVMSPLYAVRVDKTFAFRDRNCCQRIYAAISQGG